jgi:hypothetical protein
MIKLGISDIFTNHVVVVWFEHEICIANADMYGLNGFSEISLLFVKKGDNSSIVFFKYGSLSYLKRTSGQSKQAELTLYKGRRKWSSKRAVYYANSVAAFHLILNCGDVEVNPPKSSIENSANKTKLSSLQKINKLTGVNCSIGAIALNGYKQFLLLCSLNSHSVRNKTDDIL